MRTRRIRGLPRPVIPPQEAETPAAQTFAPDTIGDRYDDWTASAARDTNQKSTRDFLACMRVFIAALHDNYIKANLEIALRGYSPQSRSPNDPSANEVMPEGAAQRGRYLECNNDMMWLLYNGRGVNGEISVRDIPAFTSSWPLEVVDEVGRVLDGAGFLAPDLIRRRIEQIPDPRPSQQSQREIIRDTLGQSRDPVLRSIARSAAQSDITGRQLDELRALIHHQGLRFDNLNNTISTTENVVRELKLTVFRLSVILGTFVLGLVGLCLQVMLR